MKIGILTFHRPHNYGALLQAIALRYYLVNLGHKVYYVDYWPEYHRNAYSPFNRTLFENMGIKEKVRMLFKSLFFIRGRQKRVNVFLPFIDEFITPYCLPYNSKEKYDLVIYGSDQIWRNFKSLGNHQDFTYFGHNIVNTSRHASYAASMGNIIIKDEDDKLIKEGLLKFSHIGVRENNIYDILNNWGFKNLYINIDPTLLISKECWDRLLNPKRIIEEPYLVTYSLRKSFDDKKMEDFASRNKLRIIRIGSNYSYKDRKNRYNITSPYDFVSLIKYADFCFMSSFHGLVFSIIYERQFYTSFSTASNRAETLLNKLELSSRMLPPFSDIPMKMKAIDYAKVNQLLKLESLKSKEYLQNITVTP